MTLHGFIRFPAPCFILWLTLVGGPGLVQGQSPLQDEGSRAAPPENVADTEAIQLSLEEAISRALKYNQELAQSATLVNSAAVGVEAAASEFAFRLVPGGSAFTRAGGNTIDYSLAMAKRTVLGSEIEVGVQALHTESDGNDPLRRGGVFVELDQPLFRRFGSLINQEALIQANQRVKETRRNREIQIDALMLRTAETYTRIIQLEGQIVADERFLDRMEKLFELTKVRERQGRSSRVDTLRVDLQKGQAATRLQQNKERLQLTRLDLADLIGLPQGIPYHLKEPPHMALQLPPVEEAVKTSFEHRLDYAQALESIRDRQRGVEIANRNLLPDVSLVTRYEQFGEGVSTSDATALDEDDWSVGLRANREFNPRKDQAGVSQARMAVQGAFDQLTVLELNIARQVQQSILSHRSALRELEIAERNTQLAAGRAELARRMFQMGRGDNFTVTDAEEAHIQAENALFESRARLVVTAFQLMRDLGTLHEVPGDLKPRHVERP